jgi:hypothetical protein
LVLTKIVIVTDPVFRKLTFDQYFIRNVYIECHENMRIGLVTGRTSQTDGWTRSSHKAYFFHFFRERLGVVWR